MGTSSCQKARPNSCSGIVPRPRRSMSARGLEVPLLPRGPGELDEPHLDLGMTADPVHPVLAEHDGDVVGEPARGVKYPLLAGGAVVRDGRLEEVPEAVELVPPLEVGVPGALPRPAEERVEVAVGLLGGERRRDELVEEVGMGADPAGCLPGEGLDEACRPRSRRTRARGARSARRSRPPRGSRPIRAGASTRSSARWSRWWRGPGVGPRIRRSGGPRRRPAGGAGRRWAGRVPSRCWHAGRMPSRRRRRTRGWAPEWSRDLLRSACNYLHHSSDGRLCHDPSVPGSRRIWAPPCLVSPRLLA